MRYCLKKAGEESYQSFENYILYSPAHPALHLLHSVLPKPQALTSQPEHWMEGSGGESCRNEVRSRRELWLPVHMPPAICELWLLGESRKLCTALRILKTFFFLPQLLTCISTAEWKLCTKLELLSRLRRSALSHRPTVSMLSPSPCDGPKSKQSSHGQALRIATVFGSGKGKITQTLV